MPILTQTEAELYEAHVRLRRKSEAVTAAMDAERTARVIFEQALATHMKALGDVLPKDGFSDRV